MAQYTQTWDGKSNINCKKALGQLEIPVRTFVSECAIKT